MTIVTVKVNYNCGCTFTSTNLEAAIEHASMCGHKVAVSGALVPEKNAKVYRHWPFDVPIPGEEPS